MPCAPGMAGSWQEVGTAAQVFFGLVTFLAIIAAMLTRRPLRALVRREVQFLAIMWVAVGLQLVFVPARMEPFLSLTLSPRLPAVGGLLYIASLLLLVLFAWLNRRVLGFLVIGVGLLMNTVVIAANEGRMPVDPALVSSSAPLELKDVEERGVWSSHALLQHDTPVSLLGDWIPGPMPNGGIVVLSPGDVVIAVGILLFFLVIPEGRFEVSSAWLRKRISA